MARPLRPLDLSACLLLPLILMALFAQGDLFTLYQVQTQDFAVLAVLVAMLPLFQRWAPPARLPEQAPRLWAVLAIGMALAWLLGAGSHSLLWNFPVSRDEEMVVFDMQVYGSGRLALPLEPAWRDFAKALVPAFLLNESTPAGLVSGYLPVNALLRLAFSWVADPALFNPLLALAGGVALFDVARRLFGPDSRALWVALLVYALSSQMLVNAMTTYAMTGHMALNLIWLAAFLRGGRVGHGVAIGAGFLATGLHQLVFHALFAAPFVLWRLRQGEWRIAGLYAAAYALILGWWMAFPLLAALQAGAPAAVQDVDNSVFADKVIMLLAERDPLTVSLMILNLLRFVAWQHLALLPLFLAASPIAWRDRGPAAPMIWGIALTVAFMAVILPYQGHGWGYRYLHPHLGSFALLAGIGYQRLAESARPRADGMFVALTALTAFGSIPLLLWETREFTRPHVVLEHYIASRPGDFVLVDTDTADATLDGRWAINAIDEVRNAPDLSNRPLRFASSAMNPRLVAELCRRGRVSVVDRNDMHRLGFGLNVPAENPRFDRFTRMLEAGGCLVAKG